MMQFTPKLNEKILNGDKLTDTELQVACDHFEALEAMLIRTGREWNLARFSATWEANRLRDFRNARTNGGRFSPAERGIFDINYRDGAYYVSIPDFDGGKVVSFERYEAAVRNAYFEGRLSQVPTDAQAFMAETLEGMCAEIKRRWKGGFPQEVVDDIIDNVLKPAIEEAKANTAVKKA
jgi:hypothetical protein